MNTPPTPLSIAQQATLALVWEATAAKPGNVYRGADFDDMTFADMQTAAVAIGPAIAETNAGAVGQGIYAAVAAMRSVVGVNTHLGTILLAAPLAAAAQQGGVRASLPGVLAGLAVDDARHAYRAIALAAPGGLGAAAEQDVADEPTVTLLEAMRLAAPRDLVARQYAAGYAEVLGAADRIAAAAAAGRGRPLEGAIVEAHVRLMSERPDTLIARKCGPGVAAESAARAAAALAAGPVGSEAYQQGLSELDFWLRADGHRRNPGATADVLGAALFLLLLEDGVGWPLRF
ncbi:triphosphoribosyl-dephospho-CoA synthase [Pirellulimonas nuda]|uniref:Triphosphoribosyl-dephospho-CoA synthase n=1 Tax=Pirellulimonas nuda TaxID=2528009 RepID=A0A518DJV5_9BACT|nr:triphosphoribosyl-dephospho-CoA synthase [Pirellulimonas nuda]QDU91765.1 triphosphoribosyl-dephospho-CoA synthase [Pirellulimonas nuda]